MMMTCQVNLRDPTTVDSRIYVGHLNETITRDLLDIKFSAYGRIVGFLQTQPGFCFIQYEQPSRYCILFITTSIKYLIRFC